jgi:hypothetical protein
MSKTTRIASGFSNSGSPTASSTPLRSLAISEHSLVTGTPQAIRDWLMSSRQDSLASPSARQGGAKGQPTNVTNGRPPGIPFASFDPAMRSWKTSLDLFPADISAPSLVTWPKSGMMHDGQCWERTMLVPRISGTDSGYSLPTPSAVSYGTNQGGGMGRTGPIRPSLDTMARQDMWPTPSGHRRGAEATPPSRLRPSGHKRQITLQDAVRWPSPKATDSKGTGPVGSKSQIHDNRKKNLRGITALWATPNTGDATRGSPETADDKRARGAHTGESLIDQVAARWATPQQRDFRTGQTTRWDNPQRSRNLNDQIGGQLNPTWVEWLMGWPLGWTALKPLGMDKYRQWQQQHGCC